MKAAFVLVNDDFDIIKIFDTQETAYRYRNDCLNGQGMILCINSNKLNKLTKEIIKELKK